MYTIYIIFNSLSHYVYVGQSINVLKRWSVHKSSLNKGKHHCTHLQRAWGRYGKEGFEFFVIAENLNQDEANFYEQAYIEWYAELELAYNPYWNHMGRGEVSPETRQKMRENNLKLGIKPPSRKGIPNSPEMLEKSRKTREANALLRGPKKFYCKCGNEKKTQSSHFCSECKESRKLLNPRTITEEHKEALRTFRKGVPNTEEARQKISLALKGKTPKNLQEMQAKRQASFIIVSPEGETIESSNITQFAKLHNLCRKKLGDLLLGRIKNHRGWALPPE